MPALCIALLRTALAALAFSSLFFCNAEGQNAPQKTSDNTSSASTTVAIETEMLTYRALESNSEAIACDIAAYLNGVSANFTNPPAGTVCDVKSGSRQAIVVLLPFDNSEFVDFEIWRADMATMDRLQRKAEIDCPTNKSKAATSAASALLSMSPAGPPLALAQSALALLASEESVSSVRGTVEDQAFMNGVGRELQALGVSVLMPTAYTPFSLVPLDSTASPFLASLDRTLAAQECLAGLLVTNDLSKNKEDNKNERIKRTLSDIDDFFKVLTESSSQALKMSGAAPLPASAPDASSSAKKTPAQQSSAGAGAPPSLSHLNAVLSADGLAQKLGVDRDTGMLPEGGVAPHILLIKALESGGAVTRHGNVLGTTIRYGGGSVGTYALFTTAGDLECSGNVYDYGGSIKAKEFQKDFRKFDPEPGKQMIFRRGGCRPSVKIQQIR